MPKTSKKNRKSSSSSNDAGLTPEVINTPTEHDVLQGRGGQANNWIGNKEYRRLIDARKAEYVQCQRAQKTAMSYELVRNWRALDPPGRFLEQDEDGVWHEIGDKKARRKTSQLLRENAPVIRKSIGVPDPQRQQYRHHDSGADSTGTEDTPDEEEWLPKRQSRRNSKRRALVNRSKEARHVTHSGSVQPPHPYEPTLLHKIKEPKAATVAAASAPGPSDIKVSTKRPSGLANNNTDAIQWQASLKPPPLKAANAIKKKKRAGRNKATTAAKGPSSMSKRDLYLAMKNGTLTATKANAVSKPAPKLEGSITMMPHLNTQGMKAKATPPPKPEAQATTVSHSKQRTSHRAPRQPDSGGLYPVLIQKKTELETKQKETMLPQLQLSRSMPTHPQLPPRLEDPNLLLPIEEDEQDCHNLIPIKAEMEDTNPLPIEEDLKLPPIEEDLKLPDTEPLSISDTTTLAPKPPAMPLRRVPFGSHPRDMSWPTMPLAHFDETTDTSFLLGDLADLENLGFGAPLPAPLEFETRANSGWEGPGSTGIMEEDNSGRHSFGGFFVTDDSDDCNMTDISQNS